MSSVRTGVVGGLLSLCCIEGCGREGEEGGGGGVCTCISSI